MHVKNADALNKIRESCIPELCPVAPWQQSITCVTPAMNVECHEKQIYMCLPAQIPGNADGKMSSE